MLEFIKLFFIFFKIGLFTIGGGLAALPMIQNEALTRQWFTNSEFADMIAVSQSTPGPIGINMATYVGFNQLGVPGAIVATIGMVVPSIIIICVIAKFLHHFNEHKIVKWIFFGIRPTVVGLIAVAAFNIAKISLFVITPSKTGGNISYDFHLNYKELGLFLVLVYMTNKWKHHPIFYMIFAGIISVVLF